MIFALITAQFFYYDRVTRDYAQALQRSLRAQQQANKAKTTFLRSMSHEMRTPLGAILGSVDLLRERADAPQQPRLPAEAELVDIIAKSSNDLLSLTEKSTSFAQITAGDLSPQLQTLSLLSVLSPVLKRFEDQITQKQLQISVLTEALHNGATTPRDLITADPRMLGDALLQVFENAMTYTPVGGQITIQLDPPSDDFLSLCICDSGPGIPEDSRENVFEPYERLGQAYGSQSGGGVGLTIARAYIRAMNGDIGLDQPQDGGTRVWIRLPLPVKRKDRA
nr:HAMP domain-containing sensor histidine kinase [Thalassobius sp. Cn5-15]